MRTAGKAKIIGTWKVGDAELFTAIYILKCCLIHILSVISVKRLQGKAMAITCVYPNGSGAAVPEKL